MEVHLLVRNRGYLRIPRAILTTPCLALFATAASLASLPATAGGDVVRLVCKGEAREETWFKGPPSYLEKRTHPATLDVQLSLEQRTMRISGGYWGCRVFDRCDSFQVRVTEDNVSFAEVRSTGDFKETLGFTLSRTSGTLTGIADATVHTGSNYKWSHSIVLLNFSCAPAQRQF